MFKYLRKHGYVKRSCKGSHHSYKRADGKGSIITVAVHGNDEIREGTLRNLIKYLAMNEGKSEEEIKKELMEL
ncbi:type II toxin-antitoxin system HicA family toxin [Methanooceanicella nereidis]|uniref:type II toxin-antitoxin system HicA family toxin n=1 Tax=Methanooceanicella nereidis TaxID=2052831 RepID=UPI0034E24F42